MIGSDLLLERNKLCKHSEPRCGEEAKKKSQTDDESESNDDKKNHVRVISSFSAYHNFSTCPFSKMTNKINVKTNFRKLRQRKNPLIATDKTVFRDFLDYIHA